tara:strand:+ start:844 stop:1572 length:729 start_codon:yes stop_codon:yes gene_type:complete
MKNNHRKSLSLIEKTWRFNDTVAENFDQHVNQSIPHYEDLQNYLVQLSEWFLKDDAIIYDLGCSTGATIEKILKLNISTKYKIIGIDNNQKMLDLARQKVHKLKNNDVEIEFRNIDLTAKIEFEKSNLFYSVLLFPFLNYEKREAILKEIYSSLEVGGALISVEKVRSKSSHFEDILNQLYFDFKLQQELTEEEILSKAKSLRSSMYLFDEQTVFKSLKDCGFKEYEVFFKCFNFIGYIAIK